jgi:hypothetical protein
MSPLFRVIPELANQNRTVEIVYQRCLVSLTGIISLYRLCSVVENKDETLLRYFLSSSQSNANKVNLVIPTEREELEYVSARVWYSQDDMHIAIDAAETQVSALMKSGQTEVEVFRIHDANVTPLPDNSTLFGHMLELH